MRDRMRLAETERRDGLVVLQGTLPGSESATGLRYRTRHPALMRLDGAIVGAFERGIEIVRIEPGAASRVVTIEAEVDGPASMDVVDAPLPLDREPRGERPLWAHAQDGDDGSVTAAGKRRARVRVLAAALQFAERDPAFTYVQNETAAFADLERGDPAFFERVAAAVRDGRIDASAGAFWIAPDCNIPSGESLLRALALASGYQEERFAIKPSVAWVPRGSGFPNTFPQLLRHAGVRFFATGMLGPHPQFVWRGPDGSSVVAAMLEGRRDPLIIEPGDAMLREAATLGRWTSAGTWFESLALHAHRLPSVDGELYETARRGTWTGRHDVKGRRFAIEAALDDTEELCAWCIAVRSHKRLWQPLVEDLSAAWPLLLRGDAHAIIGGSSVAAVYGDLDADYARAERIVQRVGDAARSVLPRTDRAGGDEGEIEPQDDGAGAYLFENRHVTARVRADGTVVELRLADGPSLVTGGNVLRAYRDKPHHPWDLDRKFIKKAIVVKPQGGTVDDDALVVRYRVGKSSLVARISLGADDPYLRVDVAALWEERHTLLRVENWFAAETRRGTFGTPHGTMEREAIPVDDRIREKFEFAAQRFGRVDDPRGGVAVLSVDGYGWNLRGLPRGGLQVGLSLLRGTTWPDPDADRGEQRFTYALLPLAPGTGLGVVERLWRRFAYPSRVRLFTCDDPAVLIVACKPADDGDGVVVRVRECDGAARDLMLRCGGRIREVESIDGCERKIERDAKVDDYAISASLDPYELRTFRVRF